MARISAAQLDLLRRAHGGTVYVDRDPARPHYGVNPRTLTALTNAGLLTKGDYVPLRGRPLVVTTKGLALITQLTDTTEED